MNHYLPSVSLCRVGSWLKNMGVGITILDCVPYLQQYSKLRIPLDL